MLATDEGRWLKGIRHTVDLDEEPEWFARADVRRGLSALAARGLTFDLLITGDYLEAASAAARATPELRFVIDHLAKPTVDIGAFGTWKTSMSRAASLPNMRCKISGLATLSPDPPSATLLAPWIDVVIGLFGPDRLMYGSDWPVSTVAVPYADARAMVDEAIRELSIDEQHAVMAGSAVAIYALG